jgi:hypothetical protein
LAAGASGFGAGAAGAAGFGADAAGATVVAGFDTGAAGAAGFGGVVAAGRLGALCGGAAAAETAGFPPAGAAVELLVDAAPAAAVAAGAGMRNGFLQFEQVACRPANSSPILNPFWQCGHWIEMVMRERPWSEMSTRH